MTQFEYVDLGLPSGLKWAKYNLGAENETDYGDYFMWGSTEPNNDTPCDWEHAPFNNGLRKYDKEYFNTNKSEWLDDNGNLKPEYDAVYKATDGMARMPTQDEFEELFYNTVHVWVEDYNGTGVSGREFISETDETKYIFIPAAGIRWGDSFHYQGDDCAIWSSSLNALNDYNAWCLSLNPYYLNVNCDCRFAGFVVRGVMD